MFVYGDFDGKYAFSFLHFYCSGDLIFYPPYLPNLPYLIPRRYAQTNRMLPLPICHGLATCARGRCGRARTAPTCVPGATNLQLQSIISADFFAADLVLCDPVSCYML